MMFPQQFLARLIDRVNTSIWFVPSAMGLVGVLLAFVMLHLDRGHADIPWEWLRLMQIGADGVRQVFSVTTGSMMTITGVTFSISIVALSLASNQFGPKILRNYMSDSVNKVVLGLLIGTFVYGLTVLAFIDGQGEGYIPLFATLVNLALTVTAIGGMIYFIHNISKSIQAEQIIALIGKDLDVAINKTLHEDPPGDTGFTMAEWQHLTEGLRAFTFSSGASGYIQTIDYAGIAARARALDCYVRIDTRAGKFIIDRAPVGKYYAPHELDDEALQTLQALIVSGRERTPVQDIEFAIDQLVQVALRALSPGINDPYTAITCIDWLSAALAKMGTRSFPPPYVSDTAGELRLATDNFTFAGAVNSMFDPLRQNARGNEMVVIRLLEAIAAIIGVTENEAWQDCLLQQAEMIYTAAQDTIVQGADRDVVEQRYRRIKAAC